MAKLNSVLLCLILVLAALFGGVVGSAITAVSSQESPDDKVIKANKFVLIDQTGKEKAILGVGKSGGYLSIVNNKGNLLIYLGAMVDGAGMMLHSRGDNANIAILMDNERNKAQMILAGTTTEISLGSKATSDKVQLVSSGSGLGELRMKDQKGKVRLHIAVGDDPGLALLNSEKEAVYTIVGKQKMANMQMLSHDKKLGISSAEFINQFEKLRKMK